MAAELPPVTITRLSGLLGRSGLPLYANHPAHADPTPFHDHDFIEVAVVRSHSAVHRHIHGSQVVRRGDAIVLHPGQWHGYARCASVDLVNLCLPMGLFANELAWLARDPQVAALLPPCGPPAQQVLHLRLGTDDLDALEPQLDRIVAVVDAGDPRSRSELIGLTAAVLARLAASLPPRHVRSDADAPAERAAELMAGDLLRPWTLDDLARRCRVTREHLCRRFRRVHGLPPQAWLARLRLERAAVLLLTTDAPVAAIGRDCGYPDPGHFARRFRAAFGVPPGEYRVR